MKPIIIFATLALAMTLASFSCSKNQNPTDMSNQNPAIENSDSIVNFRFERYDNDKNQCEVYAWNRSEYGTSFYYRNWGDIHGWYHDEVEADAVLDELLKTAVELDLKQYPYTDLDKENKKKSRWLMRVITAGGKDVSIVEYSQKAADMAIAERIEGLVKRQLEIMENSSIKSNYKRYTYDATGRMTLEMRYDPEGRVCGGYDPDDPMKEY